MTSQVIFRLALRTAVILIVVVLEPIGLNEEK
jgi:hypothetical protein